jgi:hypothetical protein
MAYINREWKKFLAIGCTHGHLIDEHAFHSVLDFADRWKPHTRIHHGDYTDATAFRTGAIGTPDEAAVISPDLNKALECLKLYRPSILINGNHDDRLWKNCFHHHAIVAHCAQSIVNDIRKLVAKLKCHHIDHYDIRRSWFQLGDTKLGHGFMYSENAIRDHAEAVGKCLIAHLHTVGMQVGRTLERPVGYCVGSLADFNKMEYAKARRATLRWSQGLAIGEYNDKETVMWLIEPTSEGIWRFPA